MNYIYDILLNFKDDFFEFYDWNNTDDIIHIRKIPIIKIDTNDFLNIKNNTVIFNDNFLDKIKNKTEIFTRKKIRQVYNTFLLSDGISVFAITIVKNKTKISSLLIDEELDILEEVKNIRTENINYSIVKNKQINYFKTRKQIEKEKFVKVKLNKIYDEDKLKYIYYDCFNIKEKSIDKIIYELNNKLNDKNICNKIYDFFKLIEINE